MVFKFVIASAKRALVTALVYCGKATADKIPIISTTTNNYVKPFFIKTSLAN